MEDRNRNNMNEAKDATSTVPVYRIITGQEPQEVIDCVINEQPITVMIDKLGSFTIMATPLDIEALAVGFIYSEGIIKTIDDVVEISTKPTLPNVVGIQVHDPTRIAIQRNMIVASSCGLCGMRNIDKMLSEIPACGQTLTLDSRLLTDAATQLKASQEMFKTTGGAHAAGILNESGRMLQFAEDIGRHNALDKAIGKCLVSKQPTKGCFAVLSGRISLEMVTKAARAGIELIAAVSAPSSFAVQAAEKWDMTLCGFVRPEKMNIYTGPQRIRDVIDNSKTPGKA